MYSYAESISERISNVFSLAERRRHTHKKGPSCFLAFITLCEGVVLAQVALCTAKEKRNLFCLFPRESSVDCGPQFVLRVFGQPWSLPPLMAFTDLCGPAVSSRSGEVKKDELMVKGERNNWSAAAGQGTCVPMAAIPHSFLCLLTRYVW